MADAIQSLDSENVKDEVLRAYNSLVDLLDAGHVPTHYGMGIDIVTVSFLNLLRVMENLDDGLCVLLGESRAESVRHLLQDRT
jgi:hypothetical protein